MTPAQALSRYQPEILALADKYQLSNPRIFGSVARGDDTPESDIDILVDASQHTGLLALGGLQHELQALLGMPVDVIESGSLPETIRDQVLAEARML